MSASDTIARMQRRMAVEGGVIEMPGGTVAVLDPRLATAVDRANSANLLIPDTPLSYLPFWPRSPIVRWDEVRARLIDHNRRLCEPRHLLALRARMAAFLDTQQGRIVDLTWVSERAISRPLVPMIVAGLDERGYRRVVRDQDNRLDNLLTPMAQSLTWHKPASDTLAGSLAGRSVKRVLRRRLHGAAPPEEDFAQSIIGMIDRLGVARAAYVVTTLLTAVSGAPGSVAACLLYELLTRPEWKAKVTGELASLASAELVRSPVHAAPVTYLFVREVLRKWSFPLVTQRNAARDFECGGVMLRRDQTYLLSAYITHRDPDYWNDPERFDPDRWLDYRKPEGAAPFVPFGWGHRSCVGASLGLAQLFLFCHIVTRDFAIEQRDADSATIKLEGIAAPRDFRGSIARIG